MNSNSGDVLVDSQVRKLDLVDPTKLEKKSSDVNLDELAVLISLKWADKTEVKARELGVDARVLQEKAKFLHDTSEKFKALIDKEGNVDISKDADLQKSLQKAKEEYGIKIPEQTKFDSYQRERVLESLGFQRDDWTKESTAKLKEVDALMAKANEMILLANKMVDKVNQTKSKLCDKLK